MTNTLDIDKATDFMLDTAWKILLDGLEPEPTWFLDGTFIRTRWSSDTEKHVMTVMVANEIRKTKPHVVVLVADTWIRSPQLTDDQKRLVAAGGWDAVADQMQRPRGAPDAYEAIVAAGWDREGHSVSVSRAYRHRDDGSIEPLPDLDHRADPTVALHTDTFLPIVNALR